MVVIVVTLWRTTVQTLASWECACVLKTTSWGFLHLCSPPSPYTWTSFPLFKPLTVFVKIPGPLPAPFSLPWRPPTTPAMCKATEGQTKQSPENRAIYTLKCMLPVYAAAIPGVRHTLFKRSTEWWMETLEKSTPQLKSQGSAELKTSLFRWSW